ncbi:twin-arginine translocation pathway signal [Nocardia sp. AB354]|uniref:twin-arginine translocation pathway signal n=1 Tax=Nocardia sp. AB354 TaxID=3413283 RepID=UPI003C1C7905
MSTSSDSRPEHIDERETGANTETTGAPAPSEKDARKLPRPRAALTWVRGHRAGVGAGLLGGLAAASVVAATSLYFTQYRPDQQTDDDAQRAAIAAASNGSVAILSYAPDTLDHDLTAARSFLTGDFLTYYGQFTQQVVAPAAKQKAVKTSAAVVRSAIEQIRPDSAVVLVFINQTTTTSDKPDPSMTSSSVKVSLSHIDGKWLISSFDPV